MRAIFSDLRYALRRILKSPGFAATAILTLALGIGANTVVYSVIQAVLLNSFPWPNANQLYVLSGELKNGQQFSVSWPDYVDWQAQQHSFTSIAADTGEHFEYFDGEHATLPIGLRATASFFQTIGVQPSLGRAFNAQEDSPGGAPVVVLGHDFWQNQLHGNPAAVGSTLLLSGKAYTVIGIMPPGFQFYFGRHEDFYVPMGPLAADPAFNNRLSHGSIRPLARLKPGVSPATAKAEMEAIAARLAQEYPASNKDHSVKMYQLIEEYFAESRSTLLLLSLAVGLILLVACANVSNLLIARGAERSREYAIRSAIGAGAWRIFRMSLMESLSLAIAGAACGVLLTQLTLPLLLRVAPTDISRLNETAVNWSVLAFAFAVSALVAILCGALPAFASLKIGPDQALKTSTLLASGGRGKDRLRSALLIVGVALTVMLTAGAGLLVRSLQQTLAVDPGFAPEHLLSLDIVLSGDKYKDKQASAEFFTAAQQRVRAVPGVEDVGLVMCPPLAGDCGDYFYSVPGKTAEGEYPVALFNFADADYFRAAGIKLKSGRLFQSTDTKGSAPVAIVNEAFARLYWPKGDAVGHVFRYGGQGDKGELAEIVGVIADVKVEGLDAPVEPQFTYPAAQKPVGNMVLMAKVKGDPASYAAAAESAIHTVESDVPVRIKPMSEMVRKSLRQREFLTLLLSLFTGLGLFLAGLGIFGVAAYSVSSRRAEIGLRMALGALPQTVSRWIVRTSLWRVGIGCVLGVLMSLGLLRLMRSLLFGVSPMDPLVLAATCALLLAIALLATWLPARRAATTDPIQTLRSE